MHVVFHAVTVEVKENDGWIVVSVTSVIATRDLPGSIVAVWRKAGKKGQGSPSHLLRVGRLR
jgi:hypothetical protein